MGNNVWKTDSVKATGAPTTFVGAAQTGFIIPTTRVTSTAAETQGALVAMLQETLVVVGKILTVLQIDVFKISVYHFLIS